MSLRVRALHLFKTLNRTSQKVFGGDQIALQAARTKIRQEFNNSKNVSAENSIKELLTYGEEVNVILLKNVLQLERKIKEEHVYQANVRSELQFGENIPYRDDITEKEYKQANRKARKKCKDN